VLCEDPARGLGLKRAISIGEVLRTTNLKRIPVVFFETDQGNGHFSPLLGERSGNLLLPYSDTGYMPRAKFVRRWKSSGILRPCLIAELPDK
jgi:hypothetical protein